MTFVGRPKDRNRPKCDGVIYENARTRIADITDGTSHTVLVGERPPTPTLFWGWWTWSAFDASLGVRNTFYVYTPDDPANPGGIAAARFIRNLIARARSATATRTTSGVCIPVGRSGCSPMGRYDFCPTRQTRSCRRWLQGRAAK
jgi:Protein of unknown function (DUF1559)